MSTLWSTLGFGLAETGRKERLVWMYVTTGCLRPAPFSTGVAVARLVWFLPSTSLYSLLAHVPAVRSRRVQYSYRSTHRLSVWFSYSLLIKTDLPFHSGAMLSCGGVCVFLILRVQKRRNVLHNVITYRATLGGCPRGSQRPEMRSPYWRHEGSGRHLDLKALQVSQTRNLQAIFHYCRLAPRFHDSKVPRPDVRFCTLCADVDFQLQKADPGVSVAGATRRPPTPSAFEFSLASPPPPKPFVSHINY